MNSIKFVGSIVGFRLLIELLSQLLKCQLLKYQNLNKNIFENC